jgi:hypothetical protein
MSRGGSSPDGEIMVPVKKGKVESGEPRTTAASRFRRYKKETEKKTRTARVREDRALERIKASFERFRTIVCSDFLVDPHENEDTLRSLVTGLIEHISYSATDVERFSISLEDVDLSELELRNAGLFLSALVCNGRASRSRIHAHSSGQLRSITLWAPKRLTVFGDVGEYTGSRMEDGELTINGSVRGSVGDVMNGGVIIINGDVHAEVDSALGVAYASIGAHMEGGDIHINGEIIGDAAWVHSVDKYLHHGRIFHKGKLIIDK